MCGLDELEILLGFLPTQPIRSKERSRMRESIMTRVGIIGAKAYTAGELIALLLRHPAVELTTLSARVDQPEDPGGDLEINVGSIV